MKFHRWKTGSLCLFVLLPALLVVIDEARADHAPYIVQFKPFAVPVLGVSGNIFQKRVTFYAEMHESWAVVEVCRVLPRFKEAIYFELNREPVKADYKRLQIDGLALRLLPELNQALSQPLIAHLTIIPASVKMAQGTKISHIDGATDDCVPLLKKPGFLKDYPSATPEDVVAARPGAVAGNLSEGGGQAARTKPYSGSTIYISEDGEIVGDDDGQASLPSLPAGKKCIRNIDRVWPSSLHSIDNRWYWLQQILTVDENKDGVVDNLSFNMKSPDLADKQVFYYVTGKGPSVSKVETLRLTDERLIALLCENQQVYDQPPGGNPYPAGYIPPPKVLNLSIDEKLMLKYEQLIQSDAFWQFVKYVLGLATLGLGFLLFRTVRKRHKEEAEIVATNAEEEEKFLEQRESAQQEYSQNKDLQSRRKQDRRTQEKYLQKAERRSKDRRSARKQRQQAKGKPPSS